MPTPKTLCRTSRLPDGRYRVLVELPDGRSVWRPLAERCSREMAREKGARLAEQAKTDPVVRASLGLPALGAQSMAPTNDGMSAWFDAWIADRKARGQTSTRENSSHYREHIVPVLGDKHIRDWTPDDMRALCRALDDKVRAGAVAWKSGLNIWATARKMCADAARSKLEELRVRDDNPARDVAAPDRGARTAKQFLYPDEATRFFACDAVPLRWRRSIALAIYLYPRTGELRVLRWEDVDLDHGTIHIHRARNRETGAEKATKTAHARRVAIEPTLLPLLVAMRREAPEAEQVIALPSDRNASRILKLWLKRAGVERAELHEATPTRKAITFYDLRATGITWRAIRGDDPLKVMSGAGHVDFATTQLYIRVAEDLRADFGEPFPPLPECLLGSAPRLPTEPGSDQEAIGSRTSAHLPARERTSGTSASCVSGAGPGAVLPLFSRWNTRSTASEHVRGRARSPVSNPALSAETFQAAVARLRGLEPSLNP